MYEGASMKAEWDERMTDFDQLGELPSPGLPAGERFIRAFLLIGFLMVLVIELWFVLQVFNLF